MISFEKGRSPRYLPAVTQEAVNVVGGDIQRFGWSAFRTNALFTMEQHNVELIEAVRRFVTETGLATTDAELDASSAAMLMTHQLLAEQAKIDDEDDDASKYRLPVVQPEITDAFIADVHDRGAEIVGVEGMDRLAEENQHLEATMALFLHGSGVRDQALSAAHGAMQMTYVLLTLQAEADAFNNDVFGPDPGQ